MAPEVSMKANRLIALAATLSACSCGGSGGGATPSSPTQPAPLDVTGAWHGTLRATSVTGQCAPILQYIVGSTSQFDVRLTQTGSAVTGAIELDKGTCDVAGAVVQNTLTLSTTACRPRERTIQFFVCDATNSEFVIRSFGIESSAIGAAVTGKYIYTDDIRMPVGGPVAGVLTESGELSMTRR
jgi:hypothetical protein